MDPACASAAARPGPPDAHRQVELLERSLSWTCVILGAVPDVPAGTPTPCADWDLADLLAHMVDSLEAIAEAAEGRVPPVARTGFDPLDPCVVGPDGPLQARVRHLRRLGRDILGGWVGPHSPVIRVGARPLPDVMVAEVGALEIAVHGWDVARTCALDRNLPGELAAALLPVAVRRVGEDDRPGRFAPPVTDDVGSDPASALLAQLGRRP